MMSQGDALDHARAMLESGKIATVGEANVAVVRMMGVKLITSPLPRDVRAALNAAVRSGRLGHIKKEGLRPEAFFHPNARAHALDLRDRAYRRAVEALRRVFAPPVDR